MNQKLLFFLCSIIFFCYAAERPNVTIEAAIKAFDCFSAQNERKTQEDFAIIQYKPQKGYLLGVFDGHAGGEVADYVSRNVHLKLHEYLDKAFTVQQSFEKAFFDIEEHIVANKLKSGSTAALVYISDGIACVAHIGDSRVVFGNKNTITFATCDQTLTREDERERVLKAGGILLREKDNITGRVLGLWRINGLAPSRTLGDAWAKGKGDDSARSIGGIRKFLLDGKLVEVVFEQWPDICIKERFSYKPCVGQLIAQQEYTEYQLTDTDRWGIIASDGLWDVLSNEDVLALVQQYYDQCGEVSGIAYFLCKCAMARNSKDNITVIVMDLLSDLFKKKI